MSGRVGGVNGVFGDDGMAGEGEDEGGGCEDLGVEEVLGANVFVKEGIVDDEACGWIGG